jgi:hypothetical protein
LNNLSFKKIFKYLLKTIISDMKKIGQKEIVQAILNEALTIKRKRELFKEAQKINAELKQLNEYGHPGAMLGHGFAGYEGPSPVLGLVTPSTYEEEKPEENGDCGCKLDQFPKLEKDIEEFGGEENEVSTTDTVEADDIQSLKDENEELKAKLAQIQDALGALNEGIFDKAKAAWQGVKAGVQAGKEAGQQQYQQTQQAQAIESTKKKVIEALKAKMAQLNSAGQNANPQDIAAILKQFGLKYLGKKQGGPKVVALAEGEEPIMEELDEIFGKLGAMVGGAAKKIGGDIAGGVKSAGQAIGGVAKQAGQAIAAPVQQAAGAVKQYGQQVAATGQAAGQKYDAAQAEKQAAAQAQQQKLQQVSNYNASVFNAAISALQNYQGE